jgi:RNA recognition motif-containing protein
LDGHALILQLCHGRKDGQAKKKNDKDKSSTKLLVRNVAFEATEKDLRQLFSPFGQVSALLFIQLKSLLVIKDSFLKMRIDFLQYTSIHLFSYFCSTEKHYLFQIDE